MTSSSDYDVRFSGIQRLYGVDGMDRLKRAHVAVVGIGGVGSWSVEALARTGIGAITMIDLDEVCVSNINRQLPAITPTVGHPKARVMEERIRGINPACAVTTVEEFFTSSNADRLLEHRFDFVLDAIDDFANKCLLLARCRALGLPVITVGGAGGRRDPSAVRVADLALSGHDKLLQRVRKELRERYGFPRGNGELFHIDCVYSTEPPVFPHSDGTVCAKRESGSDLRLNCDSGYGTATFITGTFGFVAAARLVRRLVENRPAENRLE